jgi:hypothetical protein
MIRVVQLLNEKNHFLEKFMSLNEKQIAILEKGHFDQVEHFYNQREDLIKIIKYIDSEVNKAQMTHSKQDISLVEAERKLIKECLKIKDSYTSRILDQDMQVLALIDQAKSQIIKELQGVRLGQRAMAGYKSNVAP